MRRSVFLAASLVLLFAGIAGPVVAQGNQSLLRVVHAVPGAPPVDVLVDGNTVFAGLAYNEVTPYAALAPGLHNIKVTPATNPQQVLINIDQTFDPGTAYSVAALGTPEKIEALTSVDDLTAPPAGQVRLRFVHASPNTPPAQLSLVGGAVLFSNVSFKQATTYTAIASGSYNLQLREPGTYYPVVQLPSTDLRGGTVYTVYATGLAGGAPPLQALITVESVNGRPAA